MSDTDTLTSLTILTHSTHAAYKAQKAIVLDLRDQLSSATDLLQDLADKHTSAERKLNAYIAENDATNRALRELDEEENKTRTVLENIRLRRETILQNERRNFWFKQTKTPAPTKFPSYVVTATIVVASELL